MKGVWIDPNAGKVTLREVSQKWQRSNSLKRESSRERDEVILRLHVLPAFGDRMIQRISRADVQGLVDGWSADHAPTTVIRMFATLKAVLTWAQASDILVRSPCQGIRLPAARPIERPVLDSKQLTALSDALGQDDAPMMWLGAVAGLRWAECAGLTVSSFDALSGVVAITHQLNRRDRSLTEPKSRAGSRRFTIPEWLVDDLAALMARRRLNAGDANALLFVGHDGLPLAYSNWRRRVWAPACSAAGLEGLRFHDLRSMNATAMVAAGVDLKTAQTRLGHSSPQMTLGLYARATADADRAAADAIGTALNPSRTQRGTKASTGSSRGRRKGL